MCLVGVTGVKIRHQTLHNHAKADLFRETGTLYRIAACGHRMTTREAPARAILLHGQSMAVLRYHLSILAPPAAFEADDIIAVN
jgi:hypothetical protein